MISKKSVIYRFLRIWWVLINMPPRNSWSRGRPRTEISMGIALLFLFLLLWFFGIDYFYKPRSDIQQHILTLNTLQFCVTILYYCNVILSGKIHPVLLYNTDNRQTPVPKQHNLNMGDGSTLLSQFVDRVCVRVLRIKPFFLPVRIQHTPCRCCFFILERYKLCGHKTTAQEITHRNAVRRADRDNTTPTEDRSYLQGSSADSLAQSARFFSWFHPAFCFFGDCRPIESITNTPASLKSTTPEDNTFTSWHAASRQMPRQPIQEKNPGDTIEKFP